MYYRVELMFSELVTTGFGRDPGIVALSSERSGGDYVGTEGVYLCQCCVIDAVINCGCEHGTGGKWWLIGVWALEMNVALMPCE